MERRKTFRKSFRAKTDKTKHLNSIEKMPYLVGCLVEKARGTINELQLSNDNYNLALKLEDRFKDLQHFNLWSPLIPFQKTI